MSGGGFFLPPQIPAMNKGWWIDRARKLDQQPLASSREHLHGEVRVVVALDASFCARRSAEGRIERIPCRMNGFASHLRENL
jgi:hypothetical protein